MPIQTESSDQTTYCVIFGQRERDNTSWCSWSERGQQMAGQAGIEKIDFKIVFPLITNEPKSCSV